jgi:hypothetical protein
LNLPGSCDVIAGQQFDVIASAYVFHEGELETKLALLTRLREEHLASGGRIVAEISFTTRADMQAVQAGWEAVWDEDECYWSAEEAIEVMRQLVVTVTHTPVPPFGRVYAITQKVADRLRT